MILPRTSFVRQDNAHRLIPSKYGNIDGSVLTRIADDEAHRSDIFDLDNATNDRLLAENNLLPGIGIDELVFAVPCFRIINTAFCHAHSLGRRFNGPDRGAWYAAYELDTAQAEVAFHKSVELAEVNWFDKEITYDDYFADFSAEFHDIRNDDQFAEWLAQDSYVTSQNWAHRLLDNGSLGIIYPSVRRNGGTCVACFRPALVMNVRKGPTFRFVWDEKAEPQISVLEGS